MRTTYQPSLFDNELGPFPANAPDTSRRAALDNYPRSGTQRAKVLVAIAGSEAGMTDHEVVERLHMSPSSERPRRGELQAAGLVAASGTERKTDTGSDATVWTATPAGREAALRLLRQP